MPSLPPDSLASLATLLPILQAFNHRHRNQHRSTHWWASFNLLRRSLHALASNPPDARPHLYRLNNHLLPRAYISFSQLVSDEQFAPLGLLLLTILARVNSILAANDHQQQTQSSTAPSLLTPTAPHQSHHLDRGVAITRPSSPPAPASLLDSTPLHKSSVNRAPPTWHSNQPQKTSVTKNKNRSKRKKNSDALSSLFASLDS
ncbi:hypothetical protein CDD81_7133 [Ophiocordyceps australis]|uniref:RNase MRP protein 1 RNA binding domain-containing protein n=1 Tax=Ophiocordyceps australis TaxID=1399860 RepID=A0A2C5Y621_9HYPO|nr:hypothetical protein CDD81_7133 [Ophiocordyceps australis]